MSPVGRGRASRAAALRRFLAEGQRNIAAVLDAAPESFESSNTREAVAGAMRDLRAAVETMDHEGIARCVHETALGFAFMHSARLGLGLWFAGEARSPMHDRAAGQGPAKAELLEIEAALGAYFLASYQETPEVV